MRRPFGPGMRDSETETRDSRHLGDQPRVAASRRTEVEHSPVLPRLEDGVDGADGQAVQEWLDGSVEDDAGGSEQVALACSQVARCVLACRARAPVRMASSSTDRPSTVVASLIVFVIAAWCADGKSTRHAR